MPNTRVGGWVGGWMVCRFGRPVSGRRLAPRVPPVLSAPAQRTAAETQLTWPPLAAPPPALPRRAETLPAAVRRWRELGVPLLLELLAGLRATVEDGAQAAAGSATTSAAGSGWGSAASSGGGGGGGGGGRAYAQQLFAQAQCFVQIANVLNEEYPQVSWLGWVASARYCGAG